MAPPYDQSDRPLQITTPLGSNVVLIEQLSGTEAMSQPFQFQLDLLIDLVTATSLSQGNAGIFNGLLNQNVTVTLIDQPTGTTRYFNGIISELTQGERIRVSTTSTAPALVRYKALLTPALWQLKRRVQNRIFQNMTVPAILQQIFQEWSLSVTGLANLTNFPPRVFCTQYRESDFDFVSRLMEEEGITYYFTHSDGAHQLVIVPDAATYSFSSMGTLTFDDSGNAKPRVET